ALYLLRPGEKSFRRYDARDGLHLAGNPVTYCDTWAPHPSCLSGGAVSPGITEIVGGGAGEVFVGYAGHDDGTEDYTDPNRHTGNESKDTQMMGDWRGLALAQDGDLWVAGKWTAGKIRWTSDLSAWHRRPGAQAYAYNFGDPYNPATGANPPVFRPPREGDPVSMSAVAVTKDGIAWFASDPLSARDPNYGLASFDGKAFHYFP